MTSPLSSVSAAAAVPVHNLGMGSTDAPIILSEALKLKINALMPHITIRIAEYIVTPELLPKRGIYYLKEHKATYKRCLDPLDDEMLKLKTSNKFAVIEAVKSYDPFSEIVIFAQNEYFVIKNITSFKSGGSTVKKINM